MPNGKKEAVKGPAELHGFSRSLRVRGGVDGRPTPVPGVVAKESGLALALLLDGSRGKHELQKVSYQFVRQDHPELVLGELG